MLRVAPVGHRQVVAGDPFNSDPDDPEVMSEEVRTRIAAGEQLPVSNISPAVSRTNLIHAPQQCTTGGGSNLHCRRQAAAIECALSVSEGDHLSGDPWEETGRRLVKS